jgi:hypothetical protein
MRTTIWKAIFFLAVPLVPLAAAHGGADRGGDGKAEFPEVQCLIRSTSIDAGVRLEGVVVSSGPLSGSYDFQVRKIGRAGSSNSAQSGDFGVGRGDETVGQVGLGLERGASYDAELVLRWDGGETSCATRGPETGKGATR